MTRFDGAAMEYVVQRWLVGSRFVSTVRIRVHVAVVVLESEKRERNNIYTDQVCLKRTKIATVVPINSAVPPPD